MTASYYDQLDKARTLGREYATNGIEGGETTPEEDPLHSEEYGRITVRDVVTELTGDPKVFDRLADWEITDVTDAWTDGYNSAEWPNR